MPESLAFEGVLAGLPLGIKAGVKVPVCEGLLDLVDIGNAFSISSDLQLLAEPFP